MFLEWGRKQESQERTQMTLVEHAIYHAERLKSGNRTHDLLPSSAAPLCHPFSVILKNIKVGGAGGGRNTHQSAFRKLHPGSPGVPPEQRGRSVAQACYCSRWALVTTSHYFDIITPKFEKPLRPQTPISGGGHDDKTMHSIVPVGSWRERPLCALAEVSQTWLKLAYLLSALAGQGDSKFGWAQEVASAFHWVVMLENETRFRNAVGSRCLQRPTAVAPNCSIKLFYSII